ncbi:hypothetical protein SAMN02745166_03204 [Prosthecobacter debontii]|uniref:Type II secretion system (T2SS), protein M subtype b n=1 Tax=Prosthecobacter debontii TaxID=48467 RepID=A0A1T4YFY5_9BACT|nr:hypothetical protein [Prosthecobacter debontii]SKB00689.1 hypothetical protein SAMN02745166_03204 [Prosthecobacter debontii]
MKKSEKLLLAVFGLLFIIIIGGGGLTLAYNHYREVSDEVEGLKNRLIEMNQAITEGAEWQRRSEWLDENVPTLSSRQEASTRLLESLQREAEKAGLTLAGREFLESRSKVDVDGQPSEEISGYFEQATVRVTLSQVKEEPFFKWMHALQQPQGFLGITRLLINPSGQGKTINAEVEVTQFYREQPTARPVRSSEGTEP